MSTTTIVLLKKSTKRFVHPPLTNHLRLCRRLSSSSSFTPHHHRRRRSVHFVPADNDKFLSKALTLGADTIVLDLEDSVKDKQLGREKLRSFLDRANTLPGRNKTEVLVRINPLSSSIEDWRDDVLAGFHGSDGFMVPKVETQDELKLLDEILSGMENSNNCQHAKVLLPIATETPLAVLNIAKIAKGPRVSAITWGCEDLSAELGSYNTRDANNSGVYLDVFRHCQTMCLLAAKAAGVQAIDGIYQNVRDMDGFKNESNYAKCVGFDGKLTLHPGQILALHKVFEPTTDEREEATTIVKMWEQSNGKGSMELNGKMIDLPHYVRAKKVLTRVTNYDDTTSNEGGTTVSIGSDNETTNSKDSDKEEEEGEEVFPRVYMGKFFEDLVPGLKLRHFLTRTVTESDNVFFTCLTLNPAPIHLDHELSKENSSSLSGAGLNSSNGKPLFNSMFTLALLVGMSVPEATHGTTVANLGFSEVLFPNPVYPGDTLRAETTILDRRESKSRPTQGIVTLQHVAYNQRGDVVCKATRQALMKKKQVG
jgi:citrate lyase subunit beta/citryl-CoA lyase